MRTELVHGKEKSAGSTALPLQGISFEKRCACPTLIPLQLVAAVLEVIVILLVKSQDTLASFFKLWIS
jgi:hypothetical protein